MLIKRLKGQVANVSEYSVTFNLKNLIKFFIYHILFFSLGTLAVPILLIFETKHLVKNMAFWFTGADKAAVSL
jgi:hypothetical protein